MSRTLLSAVCILSLAVFAHAGEVDYARDVRPILSRCLKCHGPDDAAREGGLRFDEREDALKPADSGASAIVPGKPDESELILRIFSTDENEVMPPPSVKAPLTEKQKQILKTWIAEGAEYTPHWSLSPPVALRVPTVKDPARVKNPIDAFILARLEQAGLTAAAEADRHTLIRRVSLDLTGLPPTIEEVDAFLKDTAPGAYERLVDRLLASPHYGERWARRWLDLARYADTNGYEKDRVRTIWPYRDWVIRALNADMPFNQFSIEQLAGDLLPGATESQRIATGFHRNTMLNEEGGIDPLEFRFYAMTDRVSTTATVWLGMTMGCCQCHTHKYDPFTHHEYYGFMALLNNADEPDLDVLKDEVQSQRQAIEQEIAAVEADLPNRFPLSDEKYDWSPAQLVSAAAKSGAVLTAQPDGSLLVSGTNPETDTYEVTVKSDLKSVQGVRIEALPDPSLGGMGPGRTPHGNFVLTELEIAQKGAAAPVAIARASADFAQDMFPPQNAIDGQEKTGWAIHGPGVWNVQRTAQFEFKDAVTSNEPAEWTIRLLQNFGGKHTLGRFRISLGRRLPDTSEIPKEERRRQRLESRFAEFLKTEVPHAVSWTELKPVSATSNLPLLTIRSDNSVIASGDQSKRDVYDVRFESVSTGVTALRLDVLPDEALPKHGPGRVYYEGPFGDFHLSEILAHADGQPLKFQSARHSFAAGPGAPAAIDGQPQTGWSINGRQGETHSAIFVFEKPLPDVKLLSLQMIFEKYYAAGIGRFRVSVTRDPISGSTVFPVEVEAALVTARAAGEGVDTAAALPENVRSVLLGYFLTMAPEMAAEQKALQALRAKIPAYLTTLVMQERPANNPRMTHRHKRGEFLQPLDVVPPGLPAVFPQLPEDAARNRLALARWLVSEKNPLVGRVTMNRAWAAFFGRGLVATTEDFGVQGDLPTHPELLDWLALEFVRQGWSLKSMHRLIVTSATYRQSAKPTPEALERDPENRWLSHSPRLRLEAELVRDSVLHSAGLLTSKLGGPSVFPPQPGNVTTEGAYGALGWKVSEGADRYRRGLYTFTKRTAPYAMFQTFDGPSGEACVPRRDVSNTPLQALTLLNDTVFVEASQALGRWSATTVAADSPGTPEFHLAKLFRRVLCRPPAPEELAALSAFYRQTLDRLRQKELDAAALAGAAGDNAVDVAVWTVVARTLLNLDETIVRP